LEVAKLKLVDLAEKRHLSRRRVRVNIRIFSDGAFGCDDENVFRAGSNAVDLSELIVWLVKKRDIIDRWSRRK
jgi:hypothetical protein